MQVHSIHSTLNISCVSGPVLGSGSGSASRNPRSGREVSKRMSVRQRAIPDRDAPFTPPVFPCGRSPLEWQSRPPCTPSSLSSRGSGMPSLKRLQCRKWAYEPHTVPASSSLGVRCQLEAHFLFPALKVHGSRLCSHMGRLVGPDHLQQGMSSCPSVGFWVRKHTVSMDSIWALLNNEDDLKHIERAYIEAYIEEKRYRVP